ncbi:MAG TPA: aspartate 1-decarboxylase [Desulfobacteraceae bacterium]|nr:aspartate 1-decarboxylase [Deltaproteobacteria bacterium]MBW2355815.1 aspartate 1-decarboxylase [Deltaproteobacteria bacterium]RLB99089.1 MAG: aspartate 1-decarboxylase [Deltaproteobacteria bacterium]HDI60929.1 aspartate 1-decarboxylase [Desulfobacteraceae bacterium]
MLISVLKSKLHQARVTDKNIAYVGSITIDATLMRLAGLRANERVEVYNIENGERLATYVLEGEAGSGCIVLNGAAARKVEIGDRVIVAAYGLVTPDEPVAEPKVVLLEEGNRVAAASGQ